MILLLSSMQLRLLLLIYFISDAYVSELQSISIMLICLYRYRAVWWYAREISKQHGINFHERGGPTVT